MVPTQSYLRAAVWWCWMSALSALAADAPPAFEQSIRPILESRCGHCHGEDVQKGNLNLSTRAGLLKGGDSGAVLKAGQPGDSLLFTQIRDREMPPKGEKPLTNQEIEQIKAWITAGMPFAQPDAEEPEVSQHDVLPILWLRCTVCHGTRAQEGGLDLRTRASMLKGGKSGPAFVEGKPAESLLLKRIQAEEMPPRRRVVEVSVKPIEPNEIEVLTRWIAAGAPESTRGPDIAMESPDPLVTDEDRSFWSFRPPRRTAPPPLAGEIPANHWIDAFIREKLAGAGLPPSPEADRRVLIRRLTFDVIGLPPTPAELDEVLADAAPDALDRLTDRLLASPHYGERWGRYWLDLAGYADSTGVQHADPLRDQIWRYRDYVIRALNADKPYDRFLAEQIAGDELGNADDAAELTEELYDNLAATGFLRLTPDGTHANITNFVPDRLDIIADELHVLTSAVLGLTVKCARCHTHKSDPIPQRDYYRLAAVFKGALDEHNWMRGIDNIAPWPERRLAKALPEELAAWTALDAQLNQERDEAQAALSTRTTELQRMIFEERLAKLPEGERAAIREAVETPADQRTEGQKSLAEKHEPLLRVSVDELKQLDADFKTLADQTAAKIQGVNARRKPRPTLQALWDRGEASPTYLLRRGDYKKFGREVGPGVISVLTDGKTPFRVEPPWPGAQKTGRRLAFARWLAELDHPLTARVLVNRLWRHHFGAGIVTTLDNFGKTGSPPSHPELLDQLALEAVRGNWSLKRMHRQLLSSSTWRQASAISADANRIDPENVWLSRMSLKRLEAETLRDALLAVSGKLNSTPFGPPDQVETAASGMVSDTGHRRAVYVLQRRTTILTLLEDFDLPSMNPNCVDRPLSTVAPQALHLMNSRRVHGLAEDFAARVKAEAGDDPDRRIDLAWQLAWSRSPNGEERDVARSLLADITAQWEQHPAETVSPADHALGSLCHALFNSAEFLMID